jgi:hypothetical protein
MRKDLKKRLKILGIVSLLETALCLAAATASWAIADHDLATLDRTFRQGARTEKHAFVMMIILGAVVALNLVGMAITFIKGYKSVAYASLLVTAGLASLFFLPVRVSVYGFAGMIAAYIAFLVLKLVWAMASWPFKRIFRRKPKEGETKTPAVPEPPKAP